MNMKLVADAMAPYGLIVRGGFHPEAADLVPMLANRRVAATVVIVGNAGPAMWAQFAESPERHLEVEPLNTWTRRVVTAANMSLDADVLYSFDGPPYYPFQRWAQRAEPVWSSPIGILVHPEYGLWHGYRAALLFEERLALGTWVDTDSPCDTCVDRPCLNTCPVSAFTSDGYDVARCVSHISTPAGSDCISLGCRARRACPVGKTFHYQPVQAEFHQQAFYHSRMAREAQ